MQKVLLLAGLIACLAAVPAQAQEGDSTRTAQVTFVAGQNVYLDAGRDDDIRAGDTLTVFRDGAPVGRLSVVESTAERSVVAFLGEPFPITRGARLSFRRTGTVEVPPSDDDPPPAAPPDSAAQEQPRLTAERPRTGAQYSERSGPQLSGRVLMNVHTLSSSTRARFDDAEATRRLFVTPSMSLRARATNLPGGVRAFVNVRGSYRYARQTSISPEEDFRFYELRLERDVGDVAQVQAGRFYNRYETYSGYWDGVLVHVGGAQKGVGVAAGFLPNRANEGFSSEAPRFSGFAHYATQIADDLRYGINASYHEIRPTDQRSMRRFVGLTQRLRAGPFSLRHNLQVDRDPQTGRWIVSRLLARGTLSIRERVRLHARLGSRQPQRFGLFDRLFSYRRDELEVGASLQLAGGWVGGDVTFHRSEGSFQTGPVYAGYARFPNTGVLGLGASVRASHWTAPNRSVTLVSGGLFRSFGQTRASLRYQFNRAAAFVADPLNTHAARLGLSVPLTRTIRTRSSVRVQQGGGLQSVGFRTSLWMAF